MPSALASPTNTGRVALAVSYHGSGSGPPLPDLATAQALARAATWIKMKPGLTNGWETAMLAANPDLRLIRYGRSVQYMLTQDDPTPANEIQTIYLQGDSTVMTGQWWFTFLGVEKGPFGPRTSRATVQAAFEGIVGVGNVTATNVIYNPLGCQIEFIGTLAGTPQPLVTLRSTLAGGGNPPIYVDEESLGGDSGETPESWHTHYALPTGPATRNTMNSGKVYIMDPSVVDPATVHASTWSGWTEFHAAYPWDFWGQPQGTGVIGVHQDSLSSASYPDASPPLNPAGGTYTWAEWKQILWDFFDAMRAARPDLIWEANAAHKAEWWYGLAGFDRPTQGWENDPVTHLAHCDAIQAEMWMREDGHPLSEVIADDIWQASIQMALDIQAGGVLFDAKYDANHDPAMGTQSEAKRHRRFAAASALMADRGNLVLDFQDAYHDAISGPTDLFWDFTLGAPLDDPASPAAMRQSLATPITTASAKVYARYYSGGVALVATDEGADITLNQAYHDAETGAAVSGVLTLEPNSAFIGILAGRVATSPAIGPVDTPAASTTTATSPPIGPVVEEIVTPGTVHRVGTLGCATYRFAVRARGGGPDLMLFDWTQLAYSRVWCDVGEVSAQIVGATSCSPECRDVAGLSPWRHELVIYRDGDPVAYGPLVTPDLQLASGTLSGKGMAGWLGKRLLHNLVTPQAPAELSTLAVAVVEDAMLPDPSPGLSAVWRGETGITAAPTLTAYTQTSLDALATLVQSGLCWVTEGRVINVGPAAMMGSTPVATLRDEDFAAAPDVAGDGATQANTWAISPSSPASGTPILGYHQDPGAVVLDGLLEAVSTSVTVATQEAADKVAEMYVGETAVTPRIVQGGTLARDAPVTIDDLVPGRLFRVNVKGCYPANQILRLTSVSVTITPQAEQVAVQFAPLGVVT